VYTVNLGYVFLYLNSIFIMEWYKQEGKLLLTYKISDSGSSSLPEDDEVYPLDEPIDYKA
jgi:hypothetical protein